MAIRGVDISAFLADLLLGHCAKRIPNFERFFNY